MEPVFRQLLGKAPEPLQLERCVETSTTVIKLDFHMNLHSLEALASSASREINMDYYWGQK